MFGLTRFAVLFLAAAAGGSTRDAAESAWWALEDALSVPPAWVGSVEDCDAGAMPRAYRDATLEAVNYFRASVGVEPVALDPALEGGCQRAALIMLARRAETGRWDLRHDPPPDWPCWTASGAWSAARSNIAANPGAAAVWQYCVGSHAHRRWVIWPPLATMGAGSVWRAGLGGANALNVFGAVDYARGVRGRAVAFPPPGWFPRPAFPSDWSCSMEGADFSAATASVSINGFPVSVGRVATGQFGDPAIVFTPGAILSGAGPDAVARVTINGARIDGATIKIEYEINAFWPGARPNAAENWEDYE